MIDLNSPGKALRGSIPASAFFRAFFRFRQPARLVITSLTVRVFFVNVAPHNVVSKK
jgi:hypothetical protein